MPTISGAILQAAGFRPGSSGILFQSDGGADIGATAANRPRDLHLSRNAAIAGTLTVSGTTATVKDITAYNANTSGPQLAFQGLDSASSNTTFGYLWGRPNNGNADRGFLDIWTRVDGVATRTARFGTGLATDAELFGNFTVTKSGATASVKDTAAYNASTSGPILDFFGLDSGSTNTRFAYLWARPNNGNADRGFLDIWTRVDGVATRTATFGTGVALNVTFYGPITTSAPTGGAGAWELGIANSVSPTSPNRTLTVEIGGTAYYIHAKTTND